MANYSERQRILPFRNVIARKNTKRREEKKNKEKKLQITTQAVPSLLRARTCVAVRAKKKTFKQLHRPFLRSRKRRLDWGIVFKKIEKEIEKVQKSRKKEDSKSINREIIQ